MSARVLVTGASGFVGAAVVDELLARQYRVRALTHRREISLSGVESVRASLFNPEALDRAITGCDAVIHLVGIIMENPSKRITFERIHHHATRNVVNAALNAGVRRYIHMSALGSRPDAVSNYHKTKFAAEQYVRSADLDWTIFRPSLIHGPKGEFMQMEAKWARMKAPPFFFMPYFGAGPLGWGGAGMLQPVFVKDVARAFVDAIDNPKTIREIYLLGGTEQVTWPRMHEIVSTAVVGKPRLSIAMPVWKARLLAGMGLGPLLGFNTDQVIMSQEDNTCDLSKFVDDFGWTPQGFEGSLKTYAGQL